MVPYSYCQWAIEISEIVGRICNSGLKNCGSLLLFQITRLCSVEGKSFQVILKVRLVGLEEIGSWLSEFSRGAVFLLGFEKKEVGWLHEHLGKPVELESFLALTKYTKEIPGFTFWK